VSEMSCGAVITDSLFIDEEHIYPIEERREIVAMLKAKTYEDYLLQHSYQQIASSSPLQTSPAALPTPPPPVVEEEEDETERRDQLSELRVAANAATPSSTSRPLSTSSATASSIRTPKYTYRGAEASEDILKSNLAKSNIDSRLANMIVNIHQQSVKLALLEGEKRKVKKALKIWNTTFERDHNRPPTNFERKEFVGKLYEDYQKVSLL
jgi:hypothetical protein